MARNKRNERILIFRYGQLGDTLVALPAIRAVRNCFPEAELTLLCDRHENSGFITAEQVLPPGLVDKVITYEARASGIELRSALSLLKRLRGERFDTLVYLAPRLRSKTAILRDLIFFHIAGVKRVFGHRGFGQLPRRSMGSGPLPSVQHEADHLLERLRVDGITGGFSGNAMDLKLTETEHHEALQWLRSHGESGGTAWLVAFGPGSKWPSKRWPEERFLELGKRLLEEYGFTPIVVGGPEDRLVGERLTAAWPGGLNAAGELSVRGSAALLARCRMYVGNDNGVMHLAAAVGTPCVAIFAAQDWPGRWYPYGNGHIVLRKHPSCEGCKLFECIKYSMRCLFEIGVDEVLVACRDILNTKGQPKVPRSATD